MYITDLRIENLKLLRDFHLSFGSAGSPRMWTVLISENGLCKTTILRAIAMAASGAVRANQLGDVPSLPDRRQPEATMRIEANLTFGGLGHPRRQYPGQSELPEPPEVRSSIFLSPGSSTLRGSSNYLGRAPRPRPSAGISDRRPELTDLNKRELVKELATAFDDPSAARSLLDVVGFPAGRIPPPGPPPDFWEKIAKEVESGLIPGGLGSLAAAAADAYPFNSVFTTLVPEMAPAAAVDPIDIASSQNLSDWFVAGYGTSRLLSRPLESQKPKVPSRERLSSLFDQGNIVGTGFASFLDDPRAFTNALHHALVESREVLPMVADVELRGRNWARSSGEVLEGDLFTLEQGDERVPIPATWLSQGYQSTIAWIADIVGQFFFERKTPVPLAEMEGLVMIDEIDLHLHPLWQMCLIPEVKKIFPRLQFVVTTHSPMVLAALKPEEIVRLRRDEDGSVVAEPAHEAPSLLTSSQIYNRYFDVDRTQPARLGAKLRRYGILTGAAASALDDEDRAEIAVLREELEAAGIHPDTGRAD